MVVRLIDGKAELKRIGTARLKRGRGRPGFTEIFFGKVSD